MKHKMTSNRRPSTRAAWLVFLLIGYGLLPVPSSAQTKHPAQTHNPAAQADRDRGDKLEDNKDYSGAMRTYQAAYALDKGRPTQQQDAGTDLLKIGNVESDLNHHDLALQRYRQALTIARQVHDKPGEATALIDFGVLYDSLGQSDKALASDRQALLLYQQLKDRVSVAQVRNNIGYTEVGMGRYREAMADLQQALSESRQLKDRKFQAGVQINLGNTYIGLGQNDKAILSFQQALSLSQQTGFLSAQGKALADLGSTYRTMEQFDTASVFFRRALPLLKRDKDTPDQVMVLRLLRDIDNNLNRNADLVTDSQQLLSLAQQFQDQTGQADALLSLAMAYQAMRRDDDAIKTCGQARTLYQKLKNQDGEARIQVILGQSYCDLGLYDTALGYFQQALPILQQGHDWQGQAMAQLGLSTVYGERDHYALSLSYENQALSIYRQNKDQTGEAKALLNMGVDYLHLSQYDRTIEYCQQAMPIFQKAQDQQGMADTLNCLGGAYRYRSQYDVAVEDFGKALTIYQQIGDQNGQANSLMNLGMISNDLGQFENAKQSSQRALALFQLIHNQKGEAQALSNLGGVSAEVHDYDTALDDLQQALTLFQQLQNPDGQSTTFISLGAVSSNMGQGDAAVGYYRQALILAQQLQDKDSEAVSLGDLGNVFLDLQQFDTGLGYLQQALVINTQIQDRAGEAINLSNMMLAASKQAKPSLAIFYGKQAVNVYQSIRQNIQGMDKDTQKTYLKDKEPAYRQLVELLIQQGRIPEAEQVLNLLKDQEFFDFVQRDAQIAPAEGHASSTPTEGKWQTRYHMISDNITAIGQTKQDLLTKQQQASIGQITLTTVQKDDLQKQLDQADADLTVANKAFQEFLTQLAAEFKDAPQLAQDKVQQIADATAFSDTLQQLGPGTVAIYTIVEPDKVRLLVVTSQTQVAREYTIKDADLRTKVEDFRKALQEPDIDPRPYGQALYQILVAPIEKDLAGAKAKTLMWSLDDVLRYLPVAALYDGKQYLVERYQNEVFTPASDSRLTEAPPQQWDGLGLGVSQPYPGFAALTGVPQELDGVIHDPTVTASQAGTLPGTILLDTAFTQQAMTQALEAQTYPLVHIASHFDFEPGDETHSFLLLGDGSHLSLADIAALPRIFQGVDLLTLSACDTANGSAVGADGHEVEGFAVLAQRQGARAVIASLWPVADSSTPLLMDRLYKQLAAGGISKAEALRQAQLSLLHGTSTAPKNGAERAKIIPDEKTALSTTDAQPFTLDPKAPFAHPYYWAPFILIGNWK